MITRESWTAGMDARANGLTIKAPGRPLTGRVTPPGSKSITNRVLLLAAQLLHAGSDGGEIVSKHEVGSLVPPVRLI